MKNEYHGRKFLSEKFLKMDIHIGATFQSFALRSKSVRILACNQLLLVGHWANMSTF
jgi:hypothetical protein